MPGSTATPDHTSNGIRRTAPANFTFTLSCARKRRHDGAMKHYNVMEMIDLEKLREKRKMM